jgi:uncharacterized protein (DUF1330 family)
MAAYVIVEIDVTDTVGYEEYKAAAAPTIAAGGGRYIVRGGDIEVLEGDPPLGRTVVLEFPTMELARAWYRSDEYTASRRIREATATSRMYLVDGID